MAVAKANFHFISLNMKYVIGIAKINVIAAHIRGCRCDEVMIPSD
jgi:hypothetical protein